MERPAADNTPERSPASVRELQQQLKECRDAYRALDKEAAAFRLFSDTVRDYAFITFDVDSRIASWSMGAEHIFGYSAAEILGKPGQIIFTPEDRAAGIADAELETARNNGCAEDERWHIAKDGTRFWASGVLTAHRDDANTLTGFSKVLRDLTSRKLLDDRLHASEEQLRLFAENVRDYALVPVDVAGTICGWNTGAERTFGYTRAEILGQPASRLFTPEDAANGESQRDLSLALAYGRAEDERWMVRKDGSRFWARWVTNVVYDKRGGIRGFAKVLRDETERKQRDDQVSQALHEKETLLREIHHRVKNNLSVITSLMEMQASRISNRAVQQMFGELQDRVRAIAALHETLYGSQNLGDILFGPYMTRLLRDLLAFHETGAEHVAVEVESDDVALSIEQALPLGLILNELATNALKHAFPDRRPGSRIAVILRYVNDAEPPGDPFAQDYCELTVHDNGIGFATGDMGEDPSSMGLRMVRLLCDQLHGSLKVDSGSGARISVLFPLTAPAGPDIGNA